MVWPIGSLKKKSIVKKSKWSLHPKNFPATKKTKLLSIPAPKKALSKLLPASHRSISCQILFFSPPKVCRLLRFKSRGLSGWVHAPRLWADVWATGEKSEPLRYWQRCPENTPHNSDPCWMQCDDALPSGQKYPNQVRGYVSEANIVHICPTSVVTTYFPDCIFSTHFLSYIFKFVDFDYWKCQVMILPILKINI